MPEYNTPSPRRIGPSTKALDTQPKTLCPHTSPLNPKPKIQNPPKRGKTHNLKPINFETSRFSPASTRRPSRPYSTISIIGSRVLGSEARAWRCQQ